jgi:hypothetical protein
MNKLNLDSYKKQQPSKRGRAYKSLIPAIVIVTALAAITVSVLALLQGNDDTIKPNSNLQSNQLQHEQRSKIDPAYFSPFSSANSWTKALTDDDSIAEFAKKFNDWIQDAFAGSKELAFGASKELEWCESSAPQAFAQYASHAGLERSAELQEMAAKMWDDKCGQLTSKQIALGKDLLVRAAELGHPEAVVDIARDVVSRLRIATTPNFEGEVLTYKPIADADRIKLEKEILKTGQQLDAMINQGSYDAINQRIALNMSGATGTVDPELTAIYMAVSRHDWSRPASEIKLMSPSEDEAENERLKASAADLFNTCCLNKAKKPAKSS